MPFGLGFFATAGVSAAAGSFDLLETQVLGGSAASVTFSSLGTYSNYKHLQIRATTRCTTTTNAVNYRINGDTAANYAFHWLLGNGSQAQSYGEGGSSSIFEYSTVASDETASAFSAIVIDILDAFDTTKFKTTRTFAGRATSRNHVSLSSGLWRNTNALTSYTLAPGAGNWAQYSRFSLYGIKGA